MPVPGTAPGEDLRVFIGLNVAWVPYVLGALTQLCADWVWDNPSFSDLEETRYRVMDLLDRVMDAPTSVDFPIRFRVDTDGGLQYSLDQGFSWQDTGFRYALPPDTPAWPAEPNYLSNGEPAPWVWSNGPDSPVLDAASGSPLATGSDGWVFTGDHPNLPLTF